VASPLLPIDCDSREAERSHILPLPERGSQNSRDGDIASSISTWLIIELDLECSITITYVLIICRCKINRDKVKEGLGPDARFPHHDWL
jgi:hypothetical protein